MDETPSRRLLMFSVNEMVGYSEDGLESYAADHTESYYGMVGIELGARLALDERANERRGESGSRESDQRRGKRTKSKRLAIQIPRPMPANAIIHIVSWIDPCSHASPRMRSRRMVKAPSGYSKLLPRQLETLAGKGIFVPEHRSHDNPMYHHHGRKNRIRIRSSRSP